jgi:glycosyltransferase involved in cell wall biosynthesis
VSIKTLHLTNCWHRESGGIATFYRELLRGAARHERQIRLVVPGVRNEVEECGPFARIYHVQGRPSKLSPGYRLLLPHQYLLPHAPLREILAAERPDLVECCDRYTLNYLAGFLRRGWLMGDSYRPAVVGLQCERMDDNVATYVTRRPVAKSFCRWYLRWLQFPLFDHHIAVSDYVAGELHEVAQGHDVRRGVWVMPHGVASGRFRPELRSPEMRAGLESRCGAPEGSTLLLYVGRLAPEKNLALLVETVARLEETSPGVFHLVVGGDGVLRPYLERECARRIPGAACFLGHFGDQQRLAELYANCDVFIHPNPREPFGIAPLEAMASGLALVAPSSGGVPHYADASNAWLAEPTPEAFARAVREIRDNPALLCSRQRAARATAERFDWEKVTAGYLALYDELYTLVRDSRREPAVAPAFYSTAARGETIAGGAQ